MKKNKVILTSVIVLAAAVAGCGMENTKTEKTQRKTMNTVASAEKAENQTKTTEQTADKTIICTSEIGTIEVSRTAQADMNNQTTEAGTMEANAENPVSATEGNVSSGNGNNSSPSRNNNTGSSSGHNGDSHRGNSHNEESHTGGNTNGGTGSNTSSGSTSAPAATPQHTHNWVHHDATGHYETVTVQEAWDEEVPVYEDVAYDICNVCGAELTTENVTEHTKKHALAGEGGGWHTEWRYEPTGTNTVHHDAVTEQCWVQDAAAYDQCSGCGAVR